MGNVKQEHKHLIAWLERERKVSEKAKFEHEYVVSYDPDYKPKVYGMGIEIDKELAPNDWYIMEPDQLVVPRHLEQSAAKLFNADWRMTHGANQPVDPVQNAIDNAVRELR